MKSIKERNGVEEETSEINKARQEHYVKVKSRHNTIKYILETLCPKIVFCWNVLSAYFHHQKNEVVDEVISELPNLQAENTIKNNRIMLSQSIFRKARLRAIQILNTMFSHLSSDLNDIMDGDLKYSEKMLNPINLNPDSQKSNEEMDLEESPQNSYNVGDLK